MAKLLRMPEVAANTTSAVLAEWVVLENTAFDAMGAIATVETDKAAVDIEADAGGVLLKTLVPAGAEVEVGSPIAVLADVGEEVTDIAALLAELGVEEQTEHSVPDRRDVPADPESAAPLVEGAPQEAPNPPPTEVPSESAGSNGRVFASPLARRIARDHGIPIEEIPGTGPRRRVLRRDVERRIAERATAEPVRTATPVTSTPAPPTPSAPARAGGFEDLPHSRMRRAVAARLTESKQTAPHFYLRASLRADRLLALRAEINEGAATRVSVNDLLVKAVAAAHQRVPEMNVVWTPDAVRRFETVDVAVAVATERGLVTPVVRDVSSLSLTALAAQTQDLAARARAGRLKQGELEGGSISITNLGMYGVEEFAAIINPPHAAILAVGAVREEPVVDHGALAVGQVLRVTLSVDHRPVDGVAAAEWLKAFGELVENPIRILV